MNQFGTKLNIKSAILVLLMVLSTHLTAQNIRFEQITNESGRSLGFVSGMVQDSTGFLWFATRNGLYRYDGYSYKLFKYNRKDSLSIPYNDLTFLYLDRNENLWMRHYNKLFAFKNEQLNTDFNAITSKTYGITTRILHDKFNQYWIGPVKQYIFRYNHQTSQTDTFSLATKLFHPSIYKWLKQTKPTYSTSETIEIELLKSTHFLIASCGEGSAGSFYDFGQLKQDGIVLFDARETFVTRAPDDLLHFATETITLQPGNYSLQFNQDNSNSFENSEVPMNKYGIALYEIQQNSEIAQLATMDYYPENAIHAKAVKDQIINNNDYYTILTENGIHEYKEDGWHSISVNFPELIGADITNDSYAMPLAQDSSNTYWIGSHNGLIQITPDTIITHHIFQNQRGLYTLFIDRTQTVWLTSRNGIHLFNPHSETYSHIEQTNENRLYNNRVWQVLEDHSHNIWIATMGGLNKQRPSWFQHVDLGMDNFSPFPIIDVPGNQFLAAGQSRSLHFFDLNTQKKDTIHIPTEPFPIDPYSNKPEIDIRDVLCKKDKLYLAFANRLGVFEYKNRAFIQHIEVPNLTIGDREIKNKVLFTIDASQSLWIAAIDGLYEVNYNLDSIQSFLPFENNVQSMLDLDNRYVKDISKMGKNFLIRTASNILVFDPEKKQLINRFSFNPNNYLTSMANGNCFVDSTQNKIWFSEIPNIYRMSVTNYAIDTFNISLDVDLGDCHTYKIDTLLWITTNNGLIRFNPNNQKYIRYTTSDGLSDNNINGVFPDVHGNIWISTLKGLNKMNITSEETESFFRSNDFNTYSFLKQHHRHPSFESNLVLPTTSGFFRFNPDSLNPYKPPIIVSNITIFGKEADFDSISHQKRHIELPFKQNFITFELAALDFTEPSKNKFRYKLENFNEQWIYTDANNRKAPYTGLPPGDYVFVAQGSNNDGLWSNEIRVRLIIHPPWYRTTFAYISYILLIVFSIVFFIRYRERKLKYEKKVLEEKVRQRTAEIRKQNKEITHQRDEIAEQKKDITDSIHYASRIQAALLPSDDFAKSVLDSYFILFKPRDIVSGDYYWLAQIDSKTIVVAADCTGHGVPGAFMSMLGVAFLNEIVVRDKTIAANEILDRLRQYVIKSLKQTGSDGGSKDGMDVALTIIDHTTSTAQFAGAYNPLYIIRNGELETIKADRMPIGYHIKVNKPFTNNQVQLQKGDRLYTFSDGYPDQFGGDKGRKFMSKRFKNLLIETSTLGMAEQKQVLDDTMEAWKGNTYEQIDDILVVGIKI